MRKGSRSKNKSQAIRAILALMMLCIGGLSYGQGFTDYEYKIHVDSSRYKVGASIPLWQEWTFPKDAEVLNPSVPDSFGPLKRVDIGEIDFTKEDGFTKATRISEFTVLDTGEFTIPPHQWYFKDSQYVESGPFNLQIALVKADTALPVKPIFKVKDVPYTTAEILTWIAIGVAIVAALLALLWLLFVYLPSRKKEVVVMPERVIPPFESALKSLKDLEEKALWQKGQIKAYHSEISEILRLYIEKHFSLSVVDLPTDDVIERVRLLKLDRTIILNLNNALQIGDLAKFAKGSPGPEDNIYCLDSAIKFVKETSHHFDSNEAED